MDGSDWRWCVFKVDHQTQPPPANTSAANTSGISVNSKNVSLTFGEQESTGGGNEKRPADFFLTLPTDRFIEF